MTSLTWWDITIIIFVGFQVNKNALWLKSEVIQEVRDQTRILTWFANDKYKDFGAQLNIRSAPVKLKMVLYWTIEKTNIIP